MTVMVSTEHKMEFGSTDEVAMLGKLDWVDEKSWTGQDGSGKCGKTCWKDLGRLVAGRQL
jgi:hypothetical protein